MASPHRSLLTGPFRKIVIGVAFFVLIFLVAVAGYLAAGWQLADSVYMVIITIFGVGYGEVKPVESPALRAFTISVIISGYAAVIYTVGGFVQMLIDGELNRALGARRMTRGIERLSGHAILCGFGRLGAMLAQELSKTNKPFVVIENDEARIREAESSEYLVVMGNATDEDTLHRAGIERASVLATVLTDDAANLYITLTARELNPNLEIIARGESGAAEKKLLRCGANKVVMPAAIGAARLAHMITRPAAESLLADVDVQSNLNDELAQIGLSLDELKISANSPLSGHRVADIEVQGNRGFLIVAVRRHDGQVILNPPGETPLLTGDVVIVVGHHDDLPQLAKRYVLQKEMIYRGARIQ